MKREDIIASPDIQWIEIWVQRIESLGLKCSNVQEVWNKESFTKKDLIGAQLKDALHFYNLANELLVLSKEK